MLNIVFMGTPDFAEESLKAIHEAGHNIMVVVTNPDKPSGRGMKLVASPVKKYAIENGIKVLQPEKVKKNEEFIDLIKDMNPDLICVVAYGKILPKAILEIPKLGCINVHGSLLPQYRGAAPIQWAVLNGDKQTGITTMYMDVGMDTGDMIYKETVDIGENETTGELWDKLSEIGGSLLVKTVNDIEKGIAPREKQGDNFTIAPMLDKSMAQIEWNNKNSEEIKNLVRGLNPIMGAYSFLNDKKIKFWKIVSLKENEIEEMNLIAEEKDAKPGTVVYSNVKKGLYIKAKSGIISVVEIQGENARRMSIGDFLRGNNIEVGSVFNYKDL